MNTDEIKTSLRSFKRFKGVFPADRIPMELTIGHAVIVNTDVSSLPGQHWVALLATSKDEGEYFDSFGRFPFTRELISWCDRQFQRGFSYSNIVLQHPFSDSCGQFCIQFVKHRLSGLSYQQFLSDYSSNLVENEFVTHRMCPDVRRRHRV